MKKTMYYSDRVKLEKIFLGIIWLTSGIFGFFDGIVNLIMQAIALTALIYTVLKVAKAKKENADEMAEQNMNKAKALALDYMQIVYCCLAIVAILFLKNVELSIGLNRIIPNITFIALGINQMIVGLAFRKFEEE